MSKSTEIVTLLKSTMKDISEKESGSGRTWQAEGSNEISMESVVQ